MISFVGVSITGGVAGAGLMHKLMLDLHPSLHHLVPTVVVLY